MTTVRRTQRFYRVDYIGLSWVLRADLLGNARVADLYRSASDGNLPITITTTSRTETVRACSWCRARPRAWEWDRDRRRELAYCDQRQCRAARRAAHRGEIQPPSYLAFRAVPSPRTPPGTARSRPLSAPFVTPAHPTHPTASHQEVTDVTSPPPAAPHAAPPAGSRS
ncbi:hypothetical protein [Streptosporangium sp. NPDC002721]|uniref:hypothetical protein n=1 Tax=Streptosporangium sp. NPDC002721 TaxID=3366188 RepID=UPI00368AE351